MGKCPWCDVLFERHIQLPIHIQFVHLDFNRLEKLEIDRFGRLENMVNTGFERLEDSATPKTLEEE